MRFVFSVRSLLFALVLLAISAVSAAQVGIVVSIRIAPPELPVYEQPICPVDGYIWTPGYWAYADEDYYWVPGTWVSAPEVGYLWTPGYWSGDGDDYVFHEGYWGTEVGFYGGISYGYGYFGHGYEGGRWDNGHFAYNQSVSRVNVSINHNVYNTRVEDNTRVNRVSFNGGHDGVQVRATSQEQAAGRERHIAPAAAQTQHVQSARANPELRASANHGKPPIAATAKPGAFKDSGAVGAKEGGTVHTAPAASANSNARPSGETPQPITETNRPASETVRPAAEATRPASETVRPAAETTRPTTETARPAAEATRPASETARPAAETSRPTTETARPGAETNRPASETARPSPTVHAKDLPAAEHGAAPNTGNVKQDQKYQQQQQKLEVQQVSERQKLQTKQEQDHQRLPQKPANEPKQQQLEQHHQQQTQQLTQKQTQQQQHLQQRQQAAPHQAAPKPAEKEKPVA